MGILARAVRGKRFNAAFAEAFWADLGLHRSKAGPNVSLDNAFKVSTWFACLKVLSQGSAQVPFKLYQSTEQGGLTKILPAVDHPLYDVVTVRPNDWTTSFEFRETLVLHAAHGDAYAFKNRVGNGRISELILLNPGHVKKVQKDDYSIQFEVTGSSGAVKPFPAEAIWHIKGPSWDSVNGLDILKLAREALGLSIATEESHANLHARGVRPTGTYSVEGKLDPTQYKQLKDWLQKEFAGLQNSSAPLILDRGAKWLTQAMTGVDAQHIQTREHQIAEVCRFAGVFPMMIGQADKTATFASAEQFFQAHVKHSLAPWYARIEGSANLYLLTKEERAQGYYFKFIADGLLRGSTEQRKDYYTAALGSGGAPGWLTPDEVRMLEEFNPMGGEAAKLPPRSGMRRAGDATA